MSQKNKLLHLLIISLLIFSKTICALTIKEYIHLAESTNYIKNIQITDKISKLNHYKSMVNDWTATISPQYDQSKPIQNNPMNPGYKNTLSNKTSLQKLFKKNGLQLNINWEIIKIDQETVTWGNTEINPKDTQSLSILLSLPLGENKSGLQTNLIEKTSEIDTKISVLDSIEKTESYYIKLINHYIHWGYLIQKANLMEKRYKLGKTELNTIKEKERLNLIKKIDVLRSENHLKEKEKQLNNTKIELNKYKKLIATLLENQKIASNIPRYDILKTKNIDFNKMVHPIDLSIPILKLKLLNNKLQLLLKAEEAKKKSKLSANIETTALTTNENPLFIGSKNYNAKAYIKYERKIKNRTHKLNLKVIQQQIEHLKNEMEIQKSSQIYERTQFIYDAKRILKQIELTQKQLKLSNKMVKEEKKRYKIGRTELESVINAEDTVFQNKLAILELSKNYHINYFNYLNLQDLLITILKKQ